MSEARLVRAVVDLATLARERPTPAVVDAVLQQVGRILPADALSLVSLTGPRPEILGSTGYERHVSQALADRFPATRWYHDLHGRQVPPSISTDPENGFRQSTFYREILVPARLRDGMTAMLTDGRRPIGTLNISATRDAYGLAERQVFAVLAASITSLLLPPPVDLATAHGGHLPDEAAVLTLRGPTAFGDMAFPAALNDPFIAGEVRGVVPSTPLRFLWLSVPTVHRVALTPMPTTGAQPRATLMTASRVDPPYGLTPRELTVLTCLATGLPNDTIAARLRISPRTVHTHVERILRKTAVATRGAAAGLAWRDHLLTPSPGLCAVTDLLPSVGAHPWLPAER